MRKNKKNKKMVKPKRGPNLKKEKISNLQKNANVRQTKIESRKIGQVTRTDQTAQTGQIGANLEQQRQSSGKNKGNAKSVVIEVKNLSKVFKTVVKQNIIKDMFFPTYKDIVAVSNLSFTIKKGEAVAFLGPNGAGKTTTIKMLTGLMYPTSGTVKVLGHTPFKREYDFLQKISLVLGNKGGLNWDLTAKQSFEIIKQIYNVPDSEYKKQLNTLLDILNVGHRINIQIRKLSLGERMKFEIIASLLYKPQVLFLDEPTIGLDIIAKQELRAFISNLYKKQKTTLLLTSHDMDDIEEICDRVIIISKGKKIYDNKLANLKRKYSKSKRLVFIFKNRVNVGVLNRIKKRFGKNNIELQGARVVHMSVKTAEMSNVLAYFTKHFNLADIDIKSYPLEAIIKDIFVESNR